MSIRLANDNDTDTVSRLDAAVFLERADPFGSWKNELANPAARIYIAYAEPLAKEHDTAPVEEIAAPVFKEPCGFVAYFLAGEDIEIRKIGVLPEVRRQNIARGLIRHAMDIEFAKRCIIDVSERNAGALQFYLRLGFRELSRRKNYYADGSSALVMELAAEKMQIHIDFS